MKTRLRFGEYLNPAIREDRGLFFDLNKKTMKTLVVFTIID